MKRKLLTALALAAVSAAALWYFRRDRTPLHYTGFVEGEERVLRAEVPGRILEVRFSEGDRVAAGAVVAKLDDADVRTRIDAKREEIGALEAQIRAQEERVALVETTWRRDVSARRADVAAERTAAAVAERTFQREHELVETGASTAQLLDEARARRDQARSSLERALEMLARAEAEERNIPLARHELEALRARRELVLAQLEELKVMQSKSEVRAPNAETVVETQFLWPGEFAQPGTAVLAVLDPTDKYVQIYVPVSDLSRLQVGRRVEIELDSSPGERFPGEVSFIAGQANFTPEKIETRSDRLGQVYRAKVKILEAVERFKPGTEGNVYLAEETPDPDSGAARAAE